MKLSKIQKTLDPNILEKGRRFFTTYYWPVAIYFFLGPFLLMPFPDVADTIFGGSFIFAMAIWCGPVIVMMPIVFFNPYAKYFRYISSSFNVNQFALRPFSKEELNFIKKNFKKVKWKISLNMPQNLKDRAQIDTLQNKELEKDYIENTNLTEIDDIEMKKLQTIYYVIIGVSGVIIYSVINA